MFKLLRTNCRDHLSCICRVIGIILILESVASSALAGIIAVDGFDSPSSGTISNGMAGWRFTVDQDISVDSLGLYDLDSDGFAASHQVGIWNDTGTVLLTSTTVLAGTSSPAQGPTILDDGVFRFETITPVVLSAGSSFVIGALFNNDDGFHFDASNISSTSSISSISGRRTDSGSGFVAPMLTASERFGPNFTFTSVPEPSGLILLAIGGVTLYGWRRKRKRLA